MDIKARKKALIKEMLEKNPTTAVGRKLVLGAVLAVFLLRAALFVFELVFYSVNELELSVISNLLLLPLFLILYMVYDGNRGISPILAIAAVVRVAIYFSGTVETISKTPYGNAYTAVFLTVMILQFAITILISYASKCQDYFKHIQAVNFQIQKEFMGSRGARR